MQSIKMVPKNLLPPSNKFLLKYLKTTDVFIACKSVSLVLKKTISKQSHISALTWQGGYYHCIFPQVSVWVINHQEHMRVCCHILKESIFYFVMLSYCFLLPSSFWLHFFVLSVFVTLSFFKKGSAAFQLKLPNFSCNVFLQVVKLCLHNIELH
jgi:hypothetical protein